jgi:thiamine biosynthesis lipoprotein
MKRASRSAIISFSILILLAFSSCGPYRFSETRLAITKDSSIPVSIIIFAKAQPDWDTIFLYLNDLARLYDHRIEGSPVWTLNTYGKATLPPKIYNVLIDALDIAHKSGGAFDPAILPLTRLWNFDNTPGIPDASDITAALSVIDYTKIFILENREVQIPQGYGIDLGGIAKGALADKLADCLAAFGYENFLIEAGGDIIVSGLKPENKKWSIGIRHPRTNERFAGELSIGIEKTRIAVVTSGDYEQFFEKDGKRYHHILDPKTGYPAMGAVSVTVIAPSCMHADGLSTAAFVLGKDRGIPMLEKENNVEGFIIYEDDGKLGSKMTKGFSAYLKKKIEL